MSDFAKLSKQLYPTGRAWKMPDRGIFQALNRGLAHSEQRLFEDCMSTLDSALPDNSNFDSEDASDWERRLGLIVNPSVDIEIRKNAIRRKMNYPGNIPARQNYMYLEGQLQAAGFEGIRVYENRFWNGSEYETKSPLELTGGVGGRQLQHGEVQHGTNEHGSIFVNVIANHISEKNDESFGVDNLRYTFFIGADPLGTFYEVPLIRKDEFRQLILKLKPTHSLCFLFVNYI